MWAKLYPVNIVTSPNSWFEKHANEIEKDLSALGFMVSLKFSHHDIEAGSIACYLSYQKIVPVEYIDKTYQSLVVHASDLPRGKGFSPWVWQILEGKNNIPLCLFEMNEGLDTGNIFQKSEMILKGNELLPAIRIKLAGTIKKIITDHLVKDREPSSYSQNGEETFYKKRTAKDSELNPAKSLKEQFNLLRVVDNDVYPAFFEYLGKQYTLKIEEIK